MKFAHMADCHIGAWREPKLREANLQAFMRAVDECISQNVDFVLISGDLFNTAFPAIDSLKETVLKLNELKKREIPVYIIPGSHDFSPSGKTMLDVLENAGLFTNVFCGNAEGGVLKLRFTEDKKTGAKITGILGRRGLLEQSYYENLDRAPLEKEKGIKIFMFHSPIDELKKADMAFSSAPMSFFPKGFIYYAGGHVHTVLSKKFEGYGTFAYPGPLFPNSFSELEELEGGGFYIVNIKNSEVSAKFHPIVLYNVFSISVDCAGKSPQEVSSIVLKKAENVEFINTIVLIRFYGKLAIGKASDVDFSEIFSRIYSKGAFFIMKNTFALKSDEFEDVSIGADSVEKLEENLIEENAGQMVLSGEGRDAAIALVRSMMKSLSSEKKEGERVSNFEERIRSDFSRSTGKDL